MLSLVNFFLTLLVFKSFLYVKAGLFLVDPHQDSVCHGGEPCTVTWLDDGSSPLLTAIGVVNVGLYTRKQQLVQAIQPVDVAVEHSLTFTPNPSAGPNSDSYYISLISTSAKQNNSLPYAAFSPFFRLDKMTGSFGTPDPSATASIPIPSSIFTTGNLTRGNDGVLTTITVGTISPSTTHSLTSSSSPAATRSSSAPTTATAAISGSGSVASATPSGFATTVVTSSVVPSASLPSSVSIATSPSSALNSSSTGGTNGADSASLSRGVGISVALANLVGIFLVF